MFFHFKLDGSRSIIYCVCSVQNCTSRETNGCTVNRIFTKLLTFAFCHLGSSCPSTYCGVKVSSESNSRDEWLVDDCRVGMRRTGSKLLLLCKSSISFNCYFRRYIEGVKPVSWNLTILGKIRSETIINSQYIWKWTNANPMKILGQLASHPKLLIGSKLSLG